MPAKGGNMRRGSLRSDRKAATTPLKKRLGVKKNRPMKNNVKVGTKGVRNGGGVIKGDARLKIIEKNRTKLLDARDKLAQMAKKQDAREKLTKLREARALGQIGIANTSFSRPVGTNITMKKDRNGKISLTTNKSAIRAATGIASPTLGLAVQRQLALALSPSPVRHVQRKPLRSQRQVTRGGINKINSPYKSPTPFNGYPTDLIHEEYIPTAPPVIRRTIRNDIVPELPPLPDFSYSPFDNQLYPSTWGSTLTANSAAAAAAAAAALRKKELLRGEYLDFEEQRLSRSQRNIHSYVDLDAVDDTEMLMAVKQPLNAGIRARLDTIPPNQSQSHGIFAKAKAAKPIVSPGHRIVVSNLHTAVTQEDITELFADIGDLMVARLVRPGTAEVIYKNLSDANKAVEVYHNRQLDGQPMKCMLVNKRPVNNPTAPAITKTSASSSSSLRLSTSGSIKKPSVPVSKNNKLVPDLSTIHKVLFNRT